MSVTVCLIKCNFKQESRLGQKFFEWIGPGPKESLQSHLYRLNYLPTTSVRSKISPVISECEIIIPIFKTIKEPQG